MLTKLNNIKRTAGPHNKNVGSHISLLEVKCLTLLMFSVKY